MTATAICETDRELRPVYEQPDTVVPSAPMSYDDPSNNMYTLTTATHHATHSTFHSHSVFVVLEAWPWPRGSSRTLIGGLGLGNTGLGLGLEEMVLALDRGRGQDQDLSNTSGKS